MTERFKFCGLRTVADVELACDLGAWAVGFVLTESPRRIDASRCAELSAVAGERAVRVGVFTDEPPDRIAELVDACDLDLAQVHVDPERMDADAYAGLPLLRAFRIRDEESLRALDAVRGGRFVLDAYVPGMAGGTGVSFDWTLARRASEWGDVVLAGGLTPENVGEAIRTARPWAVDVSGGIEREKGVKDHDRMRAFAEAVRSASG